MLKSRKGDLLLLQVPKCCFNTFKTKQKMHDKKQNERISELEREREREREREKEKEKEKEKNHLLRRW
jgi:hypothetical protein